MAGINAGLKKRESAPVASQLDDANRRIGESVMEVEILQKTGKASFARPEVAAMSRAISKGAGKLYGLERAYRVLAFPARRSTNIRLGNRLGYCR